MAAFGGGRSNSFKILPWSFESPAGSPEGSDAFYTIFNHAGPHVGAPNHMAAGGGIDSYAMDQCAGPMKVFDARALEPGRAIPIDVFRGAVTAGDIVAMYMGYQAPMGADEWPVVVTITQDGAEYLATLPVRACGTDAAGVESGQELTMGSGETPGVMLVPVHHAFLSRGIPGMSSCIIARSCWESRGYSSQARLSIWREEMGCGSDRACVNIDVGRPHQSSAMRRPRLT